MFPNPAVITPKVPVQAAVNRADLHSIDQRLAMTHRDMAAQAMNPSALRKAHDNIALDDSPRLPLSQLNQYLLKAECLSIKGKSSGYIAALEFLDRSLKLAYDKSPSFRRLFNHAWVERLNNAQSRYAISILGNEQLGSGGLELPDVLKRGPKPKYVSAIGLATLSNERAVLEATVKALTQLSDHEPGHPRGANPEYVNIILKEMGIRDSAQTEHNFEQAKPKPLQHSPGSLALHQITKRFGNNVNVPTLGEGFKDKAKIHFTNVAQENLVLINQRGSPKNTYLTKVAYEEKRAASLLPDLLIRLFQSVQGSENPMEILEKLSFQNAKQRMFSYNIEKFRNPIQMIVHRDGDCRSYCELFKLLGNAAQIQDITQKNLEGETHIRLSKTLPEVVGGAPGETLVMARHSILQLGVGENVQYFDPVFGKQVDPNHYGSDLDRYLLRRSGTLL